MTTRADNVADDSAPPTPAAPSADEPMIDDVGDYLSLFDTLDRHRAAMESELASAMLRPEQSYRATRVLACVQQQQKFNADVCDLLVRLNNMIVRKTGD